MSIQAPILYPAVLIMCCLAVTPAAASACDGQLDIREATLASIKIFIQRQQKTVLTFAGYSGAGYQYPGAMMEQASRFLDAQDPLKTVINIGAKAEGIGAVYEIAREKAKSKGRTAPASFQGAAHGALANGN